MALLEWLPRSPVGEALIASPVLYIFCNAAHIFGICLLIGAIVPLDLRIMGLLRRVDLAVIAPFLSQAAFAGLILSAATGAVLFTVNAAEYAGNPAFLTKLALVVAGTANAAFLRAGAGWRRLMETGAVSLRIRISAGLSLIIWTSALLAGRWIGFV